MGFRVKEEENGRKLFKARLVARGFQQEDNFDHSEI